ncbi:MAG: hypothetical protein HZC40_01540 [Chloroflexi bacterium]|nr:hypothetical protein [Chloroflexota bacterium]
MYTKTILHCAIVALIAGVMIGCASTPTPQSPAPTGVLVEYKRTGGIAGFNDHLSINADGKTTLTRRIGNFEFTITPEQIKQIQSVFDLAKFTTLQEPASRLLVPDELSYVITYQGKAYRTSDTRLVNEIQPVMTLLNSIVDSKK